MKRLHSLILVLALLVAFTVPAFAQEADCGDLSGEDCDILYGSAEAMKAVTSGTSSISVEASAVNIPQTPYKDLSFDFSLDTSFAYDEDAAAVAMAMNSMAMYEDADSLISDISTLLAGTSAQLSMEVNFSDEVAMLLTQDPSMMFPSSVSLGLVMVDGVVYLDLSTLEPMLAESGMGTGMSGWIGIDILPLVEQSLMQSASQGMLMAPAAGTTSGGPLYTQIAAGDAMGMVTPFLTLERGEDMEEMSSFVTSVDWDAFVESAYFEQLIGFALMQNAASSGMMPSQAEIDQTVTLGRMFGPALLEGIALELVEYVDADGYLAMTEFGLDWNLSDLAAISAMAGGAAMEIADDSGISISITTENTDINGDIMIEAPADAFVLPAEMLNAMMSGGM